MSIVISIANQKGGEGKTTTAINMAHAIQLEGYRVLLIDMDPQGNTTSIFHDPETLSVSIADLLMKKVPITKISKRTRIKDLDILPSNINLAEVDLTSINLEAPYLLKDALKDVSSKYDYVVIDCPPSLSLLTVNALVASNYVVVPLQAQKFSVDGIKGLQATIEGVKRRINTNLKIAGALLTQVQGNTVLSKTVFPVIHEYFSVFKSSISQGVAVGESHLCKKTLFEYKPLLKQTQEYKEFIQEFLNGIQK